MNTTQDRLLTKKEAAEFLGIGVNTLNAWRCTDRVQVPYVRLGSKTVRYRESDLREFVNRNTVEA